MSSILRIYGAAIWLSIILAVSLIGPAMITYQVGWIGVSDQLANMFLFCFEAAFEHILMTDCLMLTGFIAFFVGEQLD